MSSPLTMQSLQQNLQTFERAQLDENTAIRNELSAVKRSFQEMQETVTGNENRIGALASDINACSSITQVVLSDISTSRLEMRDGFSRVIAKIEDVKPELRQEIIKTDVNLSQKIDICLEEVKETVSMLHEDHGRKLDGLLHSTTDLYNKIRGNNSQLEQERKDHLEEVRELKNKVDGMDQKQDQMMSLLQQISSKLSPSS